MAASALGFIPETYHADILAGTSTVDVAPYLNTGLSSAKILQLPLSGQMSIGSPLLIPSYGGLIGESFKCTIKALPNFGDNPLVRNLTVGAANNGERDQCIFISGVRLDGNRAQNSTGSQFGHGISLFAVNGVQLDVEVVNTKGDGLCIQYASWDRLDVGCSLVTGKVRTMGCARQGVAIICGEQIDLDCYDEGTDYMAVDIEPDKPENFVRNVFIRLLSKGTGNGSDISGGVCIAGDGAGCRPTNVTVDFEVYNSGGQGAIWRDCVGLILRGTIERPGRNGLVGIWGGVGGSDVSFDDVRVFSAGGQGMNAREVPGSTYNGQVRIDGARGVGVQIENAVGGVLELEVRGALEQGLFLRDTKNMTFSSSKIEDNYGHNVWISGNSIGNRFPFLKSVNSRFGYGFVEDAGCNDNKAVFARISGNGAGNVSIQGSNSSISAEP